jgi:hypothetical protein
MLASVSGTRHFGRRLARLIQHDAFFGVRRRAGECYAAVNAVLV